MKEQTIIVIEKLLDASLSAKDIAKIMSACHICDALENGADFEITDSVAEFGEANSDNDLYEGDGDFTSWGEYLLSVPGAWENIKLPSNKVFSILR